MNCDFFFLIIYVVNINVQCRQSHLSQLYYSLNMQSCMPCDSHLHEKFKKNFYYIMVEI